MLSILITQIVAGLSQAAMLFLVASGLSLIFGISRIVNFAHGSFYMIGAYVAWTVSAALGGAGMGYWFSLVSGAFGAMILGYVVERTVLKTIYDVHEVFQLLLTFGFVLVFQNATYLIWGPNEVLAPRVSGLADIVELGSVIIPKYDLFLIVVGVLIYGALYAALRKTRWGRIVRAATQDRMMVSALGIYQERIFTTVFVIGVGLAGLAGALVLPKEPANLQMDINIVIEAFVVVVIGGMGSITGTAAAAILVGITQALAILFVPSIASSSIFILMVGVLLVLPNGLSGREFTMTRNLEVNDRTMGTLSRTQLVAIACLACAFIAAPSILSDYYLGITTETLIFVLFAASIHMLLSMGGLVSFGHAAFFGAGGYIAALIATNYGMPMAITMLLGLIGAAIIGGIFGLLAYRLQGIYLAMVGLAFGELLFELIIEHSWLTGGDNGILGLRRWNALEDQDAYYYFVLVVVSASLYLIWRFAHSPSGYGLRASRDAPARAEASGLSHVYQQWRAFVWAGGMAGTAGVLLTFYRGSVFPNDVSVFTTVDGLMMALIGGIDSLFGPLVGGFVYHVIHTESLRNLADYWRLLLGTFIILMVTVAPDGVVGRLRALRKSHG